MKAVVASGAGKHGKGAAAASASSLSEEAGRAGGAGAGAGSKVGGGSGVKYKGHRGAHQISMGALDLGGSSLEVGDAWSGRYGHLITDVRAYWKRHRYCKQDDVQVLLLRCRGVVLDTSVHSRHDSCIAHSAAQMCCAATHLSMDDTFDICDICDGPAAAADVCQPRQQHWRQGRCLLTHSGGPRGRQQAPAVCAQL